MVGESAQTAPNKFKGGAQQKLRGVKIGLNDKSWPIVAVLEGLFNFNRAIIFYVLTIKRLLPTT